MSEALHVLAHDVSPAHQPYRLDRVDLTTAESELEPAFLAGHFGPIESSAGDSVLDLKRSRSISTTKKTASPETVYRNRK